MPKIVDKEEKKIEILRVAVDIFYQHGIEQRSMKHIASDLGMARSSLYSYFRSREDILRFALSYAIREFDIIKKELLRAPGPAREKIATFFSSSLYLDESIRKAITVVIEYLLLRRGKQQVLDSQVHDLSMHIRTLFLSILRQGVERGELRDHDTGKLSNILYALTESMLLHKTFEDGIYLTVDAHTVDMILWRVLKNTRQGVEQ